MSIYGGPDIETEGLELHLDASNKKSYPSQGLEVEYLIVAGGGAGGRHHGGGGGAGGLLNGFATVTIDTGTYAIVVGAGGAIDSGTNSSPGTPGGNGQNSTAFGLTAIGGGGGGQYNGNGSSGGSGGGPSNWSTSRSGGAGTSGQGFPALNGSSSYNTRGGGGGAGGSPPSSNNYNDGGVGKFFGSTFGINLGEDGWFAGGGAAGTYGGTCSGYARYTGRNTGGRGGGADGGYGCHGNAYAAYAGQANTGGGGGGEPAYNSLGGNGGSGIVIVRYKGAQKATGGDSIFTHNGHTVHVFNGSGNFVVGTTVAGLTPNRRKLSMVNMGPSSHSRLANQGYWRFNGTNEYMNVGENLLAGKDEFTIQFFVKFNNMQTRQAVPYYQIYVEEYQVWIAQYANALGVDLQQSSNAWFDGSGGAAKGAQIGKDLICRNTWYNFAWTFNRYGNGGTSGQLKGYLNGELVKTVNTNQTGSIRNYGSTGYLGQRSSSAYFDGDLSRFMIYNKQLTDQQIYNNYNFFKSKYPNEDLSIYENVTYATDNSGSIYISNNGGKNVDMFKLGGTNSWDRQFYSTTGFTAPCTIEYRKNAASGDNGQSYAMIGWNVDPTANSSYNTIDYAAYPYRQNLYVLYNNGSQIVPSPNKTWSSSEKFYIVYNTDGTLKHYNGSSLLYSVNYGTGKTVYVDTSFYSNNNVYGGFASVRVRKQAWNGTAYV